MNWQGLNSEEEAEKNAALSGGKTILTKCELRKAKLQPKHRLGTLLHSNRMEKQRFRKRVCHHVEDVYILPKPPEY